MKEVETKQGLIRDSLGRYMRLSKMKADEANT